MDVREIASGLQFPEGPVAMADGSVILVEIAAGAITRVGRTAKETVAKPGGGPNGAAMVRTASSMCATMAAGLDPREDGRLFPAHSADDHAGGRIERVDLATGRSRRCTRAAVAR